MATPAPGWNLDLLSVGIWVASVPDGVAVYANRTFTELLGKPASPGVPIEEAPVEYGIFDRDGRPYPVEQLPFSRVVATEGTVEVDDLVIHRPDGRRVFLRAMAAPTVDRSGRLTHVTVAFMDIGREVHAERARQTLETQLKFAVDHSPIALFSIDPTGTITLSEGAGLAAMGVRSGELVGKSVFDLYRDHPTIADYIRRGLAGESLWYTVEVGSAVYDTWLTPHRGAGGDVISVSGISTDVSELRKLQSAAIQSDRMAAMGALAASVAHEINNPLTYVLVSLDLIDRLLKTMPVDGAGAGRMHEYLATARTGIDRIHSITQDLRTFSRPDDSVRVSVSLVEVVRGLLRLSLKEAEARARLELDLSDTPRVLANEARLAQVVMNLIANALHAVRDRGPAAHIKIETRTAGGHAVLEVADNGPGIPPSQRERVFEPFVTTKAVGEGTGLGLFVCRNLVQELGGSISVHDRPGGGALLRVDLPAATSRPAASGSLAAPPEPSVKAVRILIVDDQPLIGDALVLALRQEGFEAEWIKDGRIALDRLLAGPRFDLVLCDLMMPGFTGMDLAEALTKEAPSLLERTVFMTGGAFTPDAARFAESRAARCLAKPFDVVAEVRRFLPR